MHDRSISLLTILATGFWLTALMLIVCSIAHRTAHWGNLGLLSAAVAIILNVRQFFCHMEARQREIFELGRESMRSVR